MRRALTIETNDARPETVPLPEGVRKRQVHGPHAVLRQLQLLGVSALRFALRRDSSRIVGISGQSLPVFMASEV